MKKRLSIILCIFAVVILTLMCGCDSAEKDSKTTPKTDESTITVEGLCLVEKNGKILIYSENHGVIALSNGTQNGDIFNNLSTGDKITVECSPIKETYPAKTTISSLEVISQGEYDDVPQDVLKSLENLNWEIVR